ncbi:putative signal peptide-containing protein [Cryptosporidium canis]|uniref:Signal peptide-containing protein n=1 Tax=Cryptosporidium canis TaxID=195482 RepID=A0A9D5HX05_9CRYT|nr:putative signal peptide-containing protein [Cryptosporidium canis]
MQVLNRSSKRLYKSIFLILLLGLLITTELECVRYKERLKEGGFGNFLLGLAGSALSTGIQTATGSPLIPNPAMGTQGVVGTLTGVGAPGAAAPGAPQAPGVATGPAPTAQMGAPQAPGVPAAVPAGMAPTQGGMAPAQGGMVPAQGGMAAAPGIPGAMGGAGTPSALSFTTISFGIVVTMMICMVMLMCRRCTKDDD